MMPNSVLRSASNVHQIWLFSLAALTGTTQFIFNVGPFQIPLEQKDLTINQFLSLMLLLAGWLGIIAAFQTNVRRIINVVELVAVILMTIATTGFLFFLALWVGPNPTVKTISLVYVIWAGFSFLRVLQLIFNVGQANIIEFFLPLIGVFSGISFWILDLSPVGTINTNVPYLTKAVVSTLILIGGGLALGGLVVATTRLAIYARLVGFLLFALGQAIQTVVLVYYLVPNYRTFAIATGAASIVALAGAIQTWRYRNPV